LEAQQRQRSRQRAHAFAEEGARRRRAFKAAKQAKRKK